MNIKKNNVTAIPRCDLVKAAVLDSSLKTHHKLNISDRNFLINVVLDMKLNDKKLSQFINQIYKLSNTGRFSLTYNLDLDLSIENRNGDRIRGLVTVSGTEKAWPELYSNDNLKSDEIETITNMSNKEYYAILNTIQTAGSVKDFKKILPCLDSSDNNSINNSIDINGYHNSVYSKCYNKICLYEKQQRGKIISFNNKIPSVAYVADNPEGFDKYGNIKGYCLNMMKLIKRLAEENYINPKTGNLFSSTALRQLLSKYNKEIKMYQKHLELIN